MQTLVLKTIIILVVSISLQTNNLYSAAQNEEIENIATPLKFKTNVKKLRIKINKTTQRVKVYIGNRHKYTWKVSTGTTRKYRTKSGNFKPIWLSKNHKSKQYNNTPMPYAVFFAKGGIALHGTKAISKLGRPASHGCVRLSTSNAKKLFQLVENAGYNNVLIKVYGKYKSRRRNYSKSKYHKKKRKKYYKKRRKPKRNKRRRYIKRYRDYYDGYGYGY